MILVKNLSYRDILKDINIEIPNTINYLQGDNGSGKSTLLDCISNINRDYIGDICNNESIIYLNQNLYFSYRLCSRDFVSFILSIAGIRDYKKVFYNHVSSFSSTDAIDKIWNTRVGMLSGGERKKLFFSAISCIDREWYVFDEPFAGVDKSGKEYMVKILKMLQDKEKGIIITSHEMEPLNYFQNINIIKISNGFIID